VQRILQNTNVGRLEARAMSSLMRADADWGRDALTPQQRDRLAGRHPGEREQSAVWVQSPEGKDAGRREVERLVQQYRAEYGHEPDALQLEAFRRGDR
jgi:hypothetical protein